MTKELSESSLAQACVEMRDAVRKRKKRLEGLGFRPVAVDYSWALEDIGILVAEAAQEIFEKCGAADDFCVQAVGSGCAVFGGTNRVIFNPLSGFKADAGHCTARFLAAFADHYK